MLPVVLDLSRLSVVLVGNGETALRRLRRLDEAGAAHLRVYADDPLPALADAAGPRLRRHLPSADSFADVQIAFLAGLPGPVAEETAAAARRARVIVNVEDVTESCDFHSPATLRRGDLLLTVSTGGKSPGLAASLRRRLGDVFGPEWADRLDQIAARRAAWREAGASPEEIAHWTDAWIERHGWLQHRDASGSSTGYASPSFRDKQPEKTQEEVRHVVASR
jgi:precorrin-2 dehydrogenase/sirohydrochlorin ferrochelatase